LVLGSSDTKAKNYPTNEERLFIPVKIYPGASSDFNSIREVNPD